MGEWFFVPWTIQYLLGAVISLIITVPIFLSNYKSWVYRSFLGFGLCILFFGLTAFLHRNAPHDELSAFFYRIDLFFVSLINSFIFLMILFLWKEKKFFILSLVPALVIGCYAIIFAPFRIVWSEYGWTYIFDNYFTPIFLSNQFGYTILCFIILIYLLRKIPLKILRKKFILIIMGLSLCNFGAIISNIVLQSFPEFPPFGGFWILIQFIFIAIAISIKDKKIEISIEDVFSRFLSRVFSVMPGKEFGQNLIEFSQYIQSTRIENIVSVSGDSYNFNRAGFSRLNYIDVLQKNLHYLESREYRKKVSMEFMELFSFVYLFFCSESKEDVDNTFIELIQKHERFLLESNALYYLGFAKFLSLISEDTTLKGLKKHEQLLNFYERLRLALNAYSKRILDTGYREIPDIKRNCKENFTSIYTEYNLLFYDRYNYVREKTADFEGGFIDLTAEVIRLHATITAGLPIIPVFFFERLLTELHQAFSDKGGEEFVHLLVKKEKWFKYLKISENEIFFPYFNECICRNRLIRMCKIFVNNFVNKFTQASLKQFLHIMKKFSIPEAEIIIDQGKVCIIKNNNNLGYLLLNSFTNLGYSTLYIGKKAEGISLGSKAYIIIEKKSLLDEVSYENQVTFNDLDRLLKTVSRFIRENTNIVIMVNSLDDILYINSFDRVARFLGDIDTLIENEDTRFIILGNLLILNENEEQIIEKDFNLLKKSNYFYSNTHC